MATEFGSLSLRNDANLKAYYKLENVNDELGANNLTNNNSVGFNAAKFNNGADGSTTNTNKFLNVASALNYNGGAYAISLWVKATAEIGSGAYDICEIQDAVTDTSLLISYEYNGGTRRLNCGRLRSGVAFDNITSNQTFGTSTFHHIVLTYDGSTVRLYFNNSDVGNAASSGNGSVALTSGFELLVGRAGASGNFTSGIIDDVALFNRNLTAAEVNTIYTGAGAGASFLFNFM